MSYRSLLLACATIGAGFAGGALYQVALAPGAIAAESNPPAEVRATRFVLVDESGQTKAAIGTFAPVFATGDKNPPPVKEMTGIVIYGEDGKPDIQLGRGGTVSRLEMRGREGWMTIGVHPDGSGMGIWVPQETLRFGMGFTREGNGGVTILDLLGHERMGMGMPANAGISMSFKDPDGTKVWEAP